MMLQTFDDYIEQAQTGLLSAKALLAQEISNYPAPISGCDAQFNHLLAERQRVLNALSVLEQAVFVPTPRAPTPETRIESR